MQRIFRTLLFWTLILCACSTSLSPADTFPQIATETTAPSTTVSITTTEAVSDRPPDGEITAPAPTFEGCAYQWAYQDLPKLSSDFQQSIQALQAEAQASAFVFGENCIHAEGRTDFIAMETDFNVTLQVTDLSNEAELGEWIVKVMQVIEKIPEEEIVGPRPGRVSIALQVSSEQKFVNFYVDQYRALPAGMSNTEIYQALQSP